LATIAMVEFPRFVIVGEDYNVSVSEALGVFIPPLAGTLRAACCTHADFGKFVGGFFAFYDADGFSSADGFDKFGEAIQHTTTVAQFIYPAAISVWPAL
jgi:hypothetical protein